MTLVFGTALATLRLSAVQLRAIGSIPSKATARQDNQRSLGSHLGWTQTTREKPLTAPQSVIWTRASVKPLGEFDRANVVVSHIAPSTVPRAAKAAKATSMAQPQPACRRSPVVSSRLLPICPLCSLWRTAAIGRKRTSLIARAQPLSYTPPPLLHPKLSFAS